MIEALGKSGYQVLGMEEYAAADQPVDECLMDVEKADIYVGLFAFRYGYVPPADHNHPDWLSSPNWSSFMPRSLRNLA